MDAQTSFYRKNSSRYRLYAAQAMFQLFLGLLIF